MTARSSPISIRAPDLRREIGERATARARRHDVAAQVTERRQRLVLVGEGGEASLRAAGDILEEHALDRRLRAVAEDLVDRRLDQVLRAWREL